jgi:hypothetical protein
MSGKEQLEKRPKPKPQAVPQGVPFWRGVAKQKRARRLSDKAGFRKGWW